MWQGPTFQGGPTGCTASVKSMGPPMVSSFVALTAVMMAFLSSTLVARLRTSTAHSKMMKCSRGWVHCSFLAAVNLSANCWQVSPKSEEVKGWDGVHHTLSLIHI